MGWVNGGNKITILNGGRCEMVVVNSCFEDLEGRVEFKRVWEFVPKARKKRNERVKVSRDS